MKVKNENKEITIIATIGPSCNTKDQLISLKNAGVDIFRVNMSHASIEDIYRLNQISLNLGLKLGIDTEGAQIRTKLNGKKKIFLNKDQKIVINYKEKNSESILNLYPEKVIDELIIGDNIRLDFNGALVSVTYKDNSRIEFICTSQGEVGDNKGADVLRKIDLPDFTEKDLKALIEYVGPIKAPIEKDQEVGLLKIFLKDELIDEFKIYSSENIKKVNLFSRLFKSINYLIWGDV